MAASRRQRQGNPGWPEQLVRSCLKISEGGREGKRKGGRREKRREGRRGMGRERKEGRERGRKGRTLLDGLWINCEWVSSIQLSLHSVVIKSYLKTTGFPPSTKSHRTDLESLMQGLLKGQGAQGVGRGATYIAGKCWWWGAVSRNGDQFSQLQEKEDVVNETTPRKCSQELALMGGGTSLCWRVFGGERDVGRLRITCNFFQPSRTRRKNSPLSLR